jgi:hypothetical protein
VRTIDLTASAMIGIMTKAVNARATPWERRTGVRRSRWVGIIIKLTGGTRSGSASRLGR